MTEIVSSPTVAVSIVTWNSADEIADCLGALAGLPPNWSVWVVDNNSADATVEIVRRDFPDVGLIANVDNKGFAEANNQVVRVTATDFVLFLNPDTRAGAAELRKALDVIAADVNIGVLGVRLVNPDGSLQTTCFHFPTLYKNFVDGFGLYRLLGKTKAEEQFAGIFFDHDRERAVDWIKGAFMLTRRTAINATGGIPEDYFLFAEDLDFCWQVAKAGFEIRFSPAATIVHAANKSAGQLPPQWRAERTTLSKYLCCMKNLGWIGGRLTQLTDLAAINYKIFRGRDSQSIAEWKLFRREIAKSLLMSKRAIIRRLHSR